MGLLFCPLGNERKTLDGVNFSAYSFITEVVSYLINENSYRIHGLLTDQQRKVVVFREDA